MKAQGHGKIATHTKLQRCLIPFVLILFEWNYYMQAKFTKL
jgi:hypothetical protein